MSVYLAFLFGGAAAVSSFFLWFAHMEILDLWDQIHRERKMVSELGQRLDTAMKLNYDWMERTGVIQVTRNERRQQPPPATGEEG